MIRVCFSDSTFNSSTATNYCVFGRFTTSCRGNTPATLLQRFFFNPHFEYVTYLHHHTYSAEGNEFISPDEGVLPHVTLEANNGFHPKPTPGDNKQINLISVRAGPPNCGILHTSQPTLLITV